MSKDNKTTDWVVTAKNQLPDNGQVVHVYWHKMKIDEYPKRARYEKGLYGNPLAFESIELVDKVNQTTEVYPTHWRPLPDAPCL